MKFGLVMAGAFAAISGLLALCGSTAWPYTAGPAALFLAVGLLAPAVLRPVERVWMRFAWALGIVMTTVLLTVFFFVGMTLTGLLIRLLGKDPLGLRFEREKPSYWHDVEPDGPCSRPDKPY